MKQHQENMAQRQQDLSNSFSQHGVKQAMSLTFV
jgi:hypothetical protein